MADQKKQMSIALVGVRPADQVTLKGYLRVLLRLDAELEWVAATAPNIDLLMINNEFRQAASVTKLQSARPDVPVLFVRQSESDEGGLTGDTLVLPLKQISLLDEWLRKAVAVLSAGNTSGGATGAASNASISSAANSTTNSATNTSTHTTPPSVTNNANSHPSPAAAALQEDLTNVIALIKTLQTRPSAMFQLLQDGKPIAIIDGKNARIWQSGNISKITPSLTLTSFHGAPPNASEAKDVGNWLWQLALHNCDVLLPLISTTQTYQIRYWAKPPAANRRELLAIMTAMEAAPISATLIASTAQVPLPLVKKALAALLFSGNLTDDSYKHLGQAKPVPPTALPRPSETIARSVAESNASAVLPQAVQSQAAETSVAPEKKAKMGFLAKLRSKLGL